jgi:hypothetical protein
MQETIQQIPAHGDAHAAKEPILELGSLAERGDQAQMAAVSTAITLVLVVAIAFGVWQSRGGRGDRASSALVVDGAGAGEATVSLQQIPSKDGTGRTAEQSLKTVRVFLVDSNEAADAARARIVVENNFRFVNGEPEREAHVIVVEPDTDADAWLRTLAEQDSVLAGLGQPTLEVIDLRAAAGPQLQDERHSLAGAASKAIVVYLVSNETDAGMLVDVRLHSNAAMLVAGTAEGYARAIAEIEEIERQYGADMVTILDLRTMSGGGATE